MSNKVLAWKHTVLNSGVLRGNLHRVKLTLSLVYSSEFEQMHRVLQPPLWSRYRTVHHPQKFFHTLCGQPYSLAISALMTDRGKQSRGWLLVTPLPYTWFVLRHGHTSPTGSLSSLHSYPQGLTLSSLSARILFSFFCTWATPTHPWDLSFDIFSSKKPFLSSSNPSTLHWAQRPYVCLCILWLMSIFPLKCELREGRDHDLMLSIEYGSRYSIKTK